MALTAQALTACLDELYADDDILPGPVPADVLRYWRQKKLKIGFHYLDVWNEEHDAVFTAAKIMRTDVLDTMRDELARAFEEGVPFEQWKKELAPRLKKVGWWSPHVVTDPKTGKRARVDPPARLRTIYQTNMRTARAVGQLERVARNAKSRPYLLYQLGPSARHREQHLAWHGLLLPVDDPFWDTAFPPNGWGCKCFVRSVSRREADDLERRGVLAPNPEPVLDDDGNPTGHIKDTRVPVVRTAPKLTLKPWINPRSGETEFVPQGIDPGFHHRPGEDEGAGPARPARRSAAGLVSAFDVNAAQARRDRLRGALTLHINVNAASPGRNRARAALTRSPTRSGPPLTAPAETRPLSSPPPSARRRPGGCRRPSRRRRSPGARRRAARGTRSSP